MIDIEQIISTVVSFSVGGLIMMAIGFFTLKYFVRMILAETFTILKKRVISDASDKELKKHRKFRKK